MSWFLCLVEITDKFIYFFYLDTHFSGNHLLWRLYLHHVCACHPHQRQLGHIFVLILGSLFCLIYLYLSISATLFNYNCFIIHVVIRSMISLIFFFNKILISLIILCLLWFCVNFEVLFQFLLNNNVRILVKRALSKAFLLSAFMATNYICLAWCWEWISFTPKQ